MAVCIGSGNANTGSWSRVGVVAIMTGNLVCLYLAEFMTLGGGGDFLIIMKILRYHSDKEDQVYYDHPYECGVVVFEK